MNSKKNKLFTLTVTDMNDLGYGVGHIDGKAAFVKNAVTGDILQVKIIKDAENYCVAIPEETLLSSNRRIPSKCRYFPQCGGCSFCHVVYSYELELKRGFVLSELRKAGFSFTAEEQDSFVKPVLHAGRIFGYRNKVQFPYRNGKLGYFAGHSHRIASGKNCILHQPGMQPVLDALAEFLKEYQIESYDEEKGTGLLRHVLLRANADGSEMMLALVLNGRAFPREKELIALLEGLKTVKGLYYNINEKQTNVISGAEYLHIWGEKTLCDSLLGCVFELSPASFYQVNHDACELLYQEVIRRADLKGGETVADLFCGVGTIGIALAKHAPVGRLIGIEIQPEAIENARKNAERNGVENAGFVVGDANHPALESVDAVIVDPPRKGLDEGLIAHLTELKSLKKIVYVSCNPATLARDLARFRRSGWKIGEAQPVDMFPRTGHVESVVLITRTGVEATY